MSKNNMKLDQRSHDFLMYRELKNNWDRLSVNDLKWMVEYLENRLDYYTEKNKENAKED